MQLALAAGHLDVDRMLDSLTSKQFAEWQAFYYINPFGVQAETERFAIQQSNILNAPHFLDRSKKPRQPTEFMPTLEPAKQQTIEEQAAILDRLG